MSDKKLNKKILTTDYGVSYGSVSLKSLQNDNIPELDLLVREAIQNSSDAALNEKGDSYSVNFATGKFCPSVFNGYLEGAKEVLNGMFPDETADFLEIRDTSTSGLTGCIRKSEIKKEDHGNFFKLVYDTGKRQTIISAGGNWGFGKSVYYRVGIGMVVFYTRIKTGDSYEERLIITLIEDENKKDAEENDATVLNSIEPHSAGRAWWGVLDGEDLLPITDTEDIKEILSVFKLERFKGNETGTAIIIPYIATEKLLGGIIPVDSELREDIKNHFNHTFAKDIAAYLNLSIQRWYAPKIQNLELKKLGLESKWLRVSVNNVFIRKDKMYPFFRTAQKLYTAALAAANGKECTSPEYDGIETRDVNIQSYFQDGKKAGCVSVLRISKTEFDGMQNDLSPYDYIGKFEAAGGENEPIVMYARDPGMIIDYAIDGPWVKGLNHKTNNDEYMFAFFVPATKKIIKEKFDLKEFAGMQLGEYLRRCEASDHMAWNDPVKMQIVQRLQKNTVNQINKQTGVSTSAGIDATASKLANLLGKNLLPRLGYGKKHAGGSGGGSGSSKSRNCEFSADASVISGNDVTTEFVLKLMHDKKDCDLSLMIASEAGWIDAASWNSEIGTEFPVRIVACRIDTITTFEPEGHYGIEKKCDSDNPDMTTDEISVSLVSETSDSIPTRLHIQSRVRNPEIRGTVRLRTYDKKYQFIFRAD